MIPSFLNRFRNQIEELKLETIRITAKPVVNGKSLAIKKSKFLGKPYLPASMEYPKNKFGKPMVMLAQINFEECPSLSGYPKKGILQVFTYNMFWDNGNEYYLYLFHKDINQPYRKDFSFLNEELYEGLPIECEHQLSFTKAIEYGGPTDLRFDLDFDGKSFLEFREHLSPNEQQEFSHFFSQADTRLEDMPTSLRKIREHMILHERMTCCYYKLIPMTE